MNFSVAIILIFYSQILPLRSSYTCKPVRNFPKNYRQKLKTHFLNSRLPIKFYKNTNIVLRDVASCKCFRNGVRKFNNTKNVLSKVLINISKITPNKIFRTINNNLVFCERHFRLRFNK